MARSWALYALLFFFCAALLGSVLRLSWIVELPFLDYKHILHAHSHVAIMGWCFLSVAVTLVLLLLKESLVDPFYSRILILNSVAVFGMLVTFIYQGYGPISISFSTLHLLTAFGFAWRFLRGLRSQQDSSFKLFGRWSVYWMLVSSLGLWCIAPVSILLGKSHILYHMCVQFFLHFQFNGWFTFAIIAIVLAHYRDAITDLPKYIFPVLQISLVLTFALSITWSNPFPWLFYTNSLGVVLQAIAITGILYHLIPQIIRPLQYDNLASRLLLAGLFCLAMKVLIQLMVAIPVIAEISYTIRNFVVGFIHLTMLGSISLVVMAIMIKLEILPKGFRSRLGYISLLVLFVLMEVILFLQGILLWIGKGFLPGYYVLIGVVSVLIPVSLLLILLDCNGLLRWISMPVKLMSRQPFSNRKINFIL